MKELASQKEKAVGYQQYADTKRIYEGTNEDIEKCLTKFCSTIVMLNIYYHQKVEYKT